MCWLIALLLLAGAGFYFYQKMMDIEREIRAEQESTQPSTVVASAADSAPDAAAGPAAGETDDEMIDSPIVTPEVEQMTTKAEPVEDKAMSLEDELLAAVANLPGIKQTELYESFADVSRKQLQKLVKDLADSGKLKREKQGSTFLLYPG